MKAGPQANRFGEFLMTTLRDEAIDFFDRLAAGRMKSYRDKTLADDLARLTPEQREIARRSVIAALDHGLHDFLFALSEGQELGASVAVTVDGRNVAEQSDGLHGELFGDSGWFSKYSRHGQGLG
jgi:hypothetical protein